MAEVAETQGEGRLRSGDLPVRLDLPRPLEKRAMPSLTTIGHGAGARAVLHRILSRVRQCVSDESRHGHFFLFVPVWLGAGAAIWFSVGQPPPALFLGLLLACLLSALLRAMRDTVAHVVLWSSCLILLGMLMADWETRRMSTVILDQPLVTTVTGLVERREQGVGGEWRYVLRVIQTAEPTIRRSPERVSLLARSRHAPAAIGDELSGRARLSPPSGPALPGLNDFSFQSYFAGIGAVGFFLGPPAAKTSDSPQEQGLWARFDEALFSLRDRISNRIRSVLPGDPGAFAAAIITGERRSMSEEATEALRVSGLAHITAISGLNMALAAGIFFVGLRGLLSLMPTFNHRYPVKKIAAGGALLATTGYVLISGYQVSALRAYLMTAVMLGAVLFDRPAVSLHNLALAATAILAVQPSAVMGPSFQMSFAATAALIAGYAGWRARPRAILPRARSLAMRIAAGFAKFVGGTLATSLIGGVSTAIFAISHFHRLSTHGLEANLAAMPLISLVVMPFGFIAMLLMPYGLDAPFFWIMGQGLEMVLAVAHTVSGWGGGYVFPRLPAWFMSCTIAGMLLLTLLRTPIRHAGTALIVVTLAAAFLAPRPADGELMISEDARLVAIRVASDETTTLAINRSRPAAFIFDQWRPVLGIDEAMPPVMLPNTALPPAPDRRIGQTLSEEQRKLAETVLDSLLQASGSDRFTCIKQACAIRLENGNSLLTLERPDLLGAACDRANIVVLSARTRLTACRSGALLISETNLRATGSLEISGLGAESQAMTVRSALDGPSKPWTAHRLYDWRSGSFATAHEFARPPDVVDQSRTPVQMPISDNGE
ncbi:ComEC/Rec2 family competence protein [Agrobacterium albertimagni]|nr:ComEC/Rec2 family competence protein [Agrobacterium albertimagni]